MTYISFEESQKFRQSWVWMLLVGVTVLSVAVSFVLTWKEMKLTDAVVLISIPCLVVLLFYWFNLKTRIDKDGIYYQFFPFHWKERAILWSDVETAEVIKYSPLADFGGWGIKYGRKGKAYNVSGNMGFYLTLKNNKKILFGTQKPEELREVVRMIFDRTRPRDLLL
ncbi:MAG: hypothetical protein WCO63_00795 [Bacteroidota bacterium]